jgi:hypothetical protein
MGSPYEIRRCTNVNSVTPPGIRENAPNVKDENPKAVVISKSKFMLSDLNEKKIARASKNHATMLIDHNWIIVVMEKKIRHSHQCLRPSFGVRLTCSEINIQSVVI